MLQRAPFAHRAARRTTARAHAPRACPATLPPRAAAYVLVALPTRRVAHFACRAWCLPTCRHVGSFAPRTTTAPWFAARLLRARYTFHLPRARSARAPFAHLPHHPRCAHLHRHARAAPPRRRRTTTTTTCSWFHVRSRTCHHVQVRRTPHPSFSSAYAPRTCAARPRYLRHCTHLSCSFRFAHAHARCAPYRRACAHAHAPRALFLVSFTHTVVLPVLRAPRSRTRTRTRRACRATRFPRVRARARVALAVPVAVRSTTLARRAAAARVSFPHIFLSFLSFFAVFPHFCRVFLVPAFTPLLLCHSLLPRARALRAPPAAHLPRTCRALARCAHAPLPAAPAVRVAGSTAGKTAPGPGRGVPARARAAPPPPPGARARCAPPARLPYHGPRGHAK